MHNTCLGLFLCLERKDAPMSDRRSRSSCARATRKPTETICPLPLFPEEELIRLATTSTSAKREQLVREAIGPYLSLADLRRLAAKGEELHAALTGLEPLPEAVRALLTLLGLLLAPSHEESIRQPADIAALLMLKLGHLDHEEFWLVCLDTKNHVQRLLPLYKGSLNSSVVRVAEVFRLPMALNSAAIIVAHSHPSGSPQASPDDIKVTKALVKAGHLLQIEVLDHLIIARGSWLSMRDQRLGW
jgi:DNA repair protein RadC